MAIKTHSAFSFLRPSACILLLVFICQNLLALSQSHTEDTLTAKNLNPSEQFQLYLNASHQSLDNFHLSTEYAVKALGLAYETQKPLFEAQAKAALAAIYLEYDLYDKALSFSLEALVIFESLNNQEGLLSITAVLSWIYYDAGMVNKALEYHLKLKDVYQEKNCQENLAWVLNALGLDYFQLGDYAQAREYFEESLTLSISMNASERIGASLNNLGMVHTAQNQFPQALSALHQAYSISLKLGDLLKQAENLNQLGNTFLQTNQLDSAQHYLLKARLKIDSSTAHARKEKLLDNYEFSTRMYLKRRDFEKAFHFQKLYMETKDEILSAEKTNSLLNTLLVHNTNRKEQEIRWLEAEKKIKVLQRNALAGAIVLLAVIGFIIYNRLLISRKKERIIHQTKQSLIEKELEQLSLEKRYAEKEIQLNEVREQLTLTELERLRLEKEALEAKLNFKNSELTNAAIHQAQKNELINSFLKEIRSLQKSAPSEFGTQLKEKIQNLSRLSDINKETNTFHSSMEEEYKDFMFHLSMHFPDLTENEKRLCALIRLNLSIKDVASINNISVKSAEMARYRLRRKLGIQAGENLQAFLSKL